MTSLEGIEEIYGLTPVQQGMLFHSLYAPESSIYNLQLECAVDGNLDEGALEQAWGSLVDRFTPLRTSFVWERIERPYQVVHRQAHLKIARHDWRGLSPAEQDQRRRDCLKENRIQVFDLTRPPLMRLALIVLSERNFRMIWTFHHIILEGWSAAIILSDFWKLYSDNSAQRSADLPPARRYAEYIHWLQRQDEATAEAYWRERLSGFAAPTRLPIDRSVETTPAQVKKADGRSLTLSKDLSDALKNVARSHRITLNTLVQGAWAILLSRYSGESDVVFGAVVSGRPAELPAVESRVGLFVNMLPARVRVNGDERLMPWLRDLQVDQATMRQYEYSSLMQVQAWTGLQGGQPLFHTALAFQNWLGDFPSGLVARDLHVTILETYEASDQPLTLFVALADTLRLTLVYDVDRFESPAVQRMLEHCRTLLEGMAQNPQARLKDLPLLTDGERQQLLIQWNNTGAAYPEQDRCLHQLFQAQARQRADQVAVAFERESLTYGELNRRANHLAHYLLGMGAGPGVLIGLFVERSMDMVVGLLGILKAGAAYVPMDPSFPPDRLDCMMSHAGISLLVTQGHLLGRVPQSGRTAICVDTEWHTIQETTSTDPAVAVQPSNLAYTIYTSGSTGLPKGVMIEHRSVVNLLWSMQREPGFNETDVLVSVTTISFDIAALEVFLPLISGGKLVIASRQEASDGARLLRRLERSGATILQATPATWKLLIEAGWVRTPRLKMLCGGESLPRELANRMLERGGELWNMYGPTETTIWSAVQRIEPGSDPVPIGRPIANTQFYVVDKELEPVPMGVAGELLIGGDGVARGYLNLHDLTAERFIENPFRRSGTCVYRTGDLARFRPDGALEFLGRLDFQVKVRGHRVELGEIEHVLTHHAGVKDSVVSTCEDPDGDKRLVAYYIPASGDRVRIENLRQTLQEKLPQYMIPSTFVPLNAFPLTANGKIDRKALPSPDEGFAAVARRYVAPRDPLEHGLARIWSKILKAKRVGIHDSFFEMGGHSLAAIRLLSEVQDFTGKRLPLAILFQASTVAAFAEILRQDGWTPSWSSLVPIQPFGAKSPLFLVHSAWGNVLLYRQVTSHLGPDQPIYGLQSEGLNGEGRFISTIEEMASQYIKEIVTVQPHGPYFLGGYCSGGIVALEIAQQLTALGEKVETVILLDTYNVSAFSQSRAVLPVHLLQNAWFHFANGVSIRGADRKKFLSEKADIAFTRLGIAVRTACDAFSRSDGSKPRHRGSQLALKRTNDQAALRYTPKPYSGRVVLIRSSGNFWGLTSPSLGWSEIAGGNLVVHELPVYPKGMLIEPFCRLLADTISSEIDGASRVREQPSLAAMRERTLRQSFGEASSRQPTDSPDLIRLDSPRERQSHPSAPVS